MISRSMYQFLTSNWEFPNNTINPTALPQDFVKVWDDALGNHYIDHRGVVTEEGIAKIKEFENG